jgi:hypothetical protein
MQVRMRQTDLIQVDTFRMDCSKDSDTAQEWAHLHMNQKWRSALEIIVAHEKHEFAQDELFNKLVMSKWTKFGRRMYLQRTVIPYIVLLVAFAAAVVLRGQQIQTDFALSNDSEAAARPRSGRFCVQSVWQGASDWDDADHSHFMATLVLEAGIVVVGCPWLLWKGWRQRRLKIRDLDLNEDGVFSVEEIQIFVYKNLHFFLDVSAALSVITAGVCRGLCLDRDEANSLAIASVFLFCNLLNVMMPFKSIGGLVITIYRMFIGGRVDLLLIFLFNSLVSFEILIKKFCMATCQGLHLA